MQAASGPKFDRELFEKSCKQRFIYGASFDIYGGVAGLYDYGPIGCGLKNNMLSLWREHFIQEEDMLEIEGTMLTPKPVLKASGHVDRFEDLMVTDVKTGEFFRADHLLEAHLEKLMKSDAFLGLSEADKKLVKLEHASADTYSPDQLHEIFQRRAIKSPTTGNDLNPPIKFNLMFNANIGPAGNIPAFMRPETAQGIFVNYPRLANFNNNKLPFACAQIGHSFRNEISPRAGLLRVREFQMAEIEHFLDPNDKSHPRFEEVEDVELCLWTGEQQTQGMSPVQMTLGNALKQKIIDNQSIAYFMGRIYKYALAIGLDPVRCRFRQHLDNEMAHYAKDCWDLEVQCSFGWIECVGCADRSCYDLMQHAKATNTNIIAKRKLAAPKVVESAVLMPNKKIMGKDFKKDAGKVQAALADLSVEEACEFFEKLQVADQEIGGFSLKKEHIVKLDKKTKTVHEEDYVPSVIEPSFGIGRLFYCLLEHCFRVRETSEDDKSTRTYFTIPAVMSPYKCSVLRLLGKPEFDPVMKAVSVGLKKSGLQHKVDDVRGISIGKRYARTDEIMIPFGITVDVDSVSEFEASDGANFTVTVRDRDTMTQLRADFGDLRNLLVELCNGEKTWADIYDKEFPAVLSK
jgi:glycyl-tRNA synthetase